MSEQTEPSFDRLLDYLNRSRGFDFSGYKPQGLARRVQKRMQMIGVGDFEQYIDYLEVHPEEFTHLFNTILINVTSFFRDPAVWEYLRQEIIPKTIAGKKEGEQIRIWSAGCASGEEAYGLAICMAEALGGAGAVFDRVKLYATDADEDALNQARMAVYTDKQLEDVPQDLRGKYFDDVDNGAKFSFNKELRRCVIFGKHDLLQDAPISRVDLLVCRNALMYFNAESQTRILTRFHFALNDDGYLLLGRAETLLTRANLFTPVDLRRRVFAKVPKLNLRDRLLILAQSGGYELPPPAGLNNERLREAAFDVVPIAQIAIDGDGTLVLANEKARQLFSLGPRDLGRPLQDLELSYRPVELRSLIEKAQADRRVSTTREVEWSKSGGERVFFDVQVNPIVDGAGTMSGATITFSDVTRHRRLQEELQKSHQELEAAYEELQSTSEELETTNEELQSTVEELETTNEELQSSNEELETMNEELQSTNEELHTINDELRQRSEDLNQANAFMNSILVSLRTGVVVVDGDSRVQAWNRQAEDMWGLREDEVRGKTLLNLDIGLPVDKLAQPLRECLNGEQRHLTLDATNRRGKKIKCRISCSTLKGAADENRGVILLLESDGES